MEIFTNAAAYPDDGGRKIKRPVIPDYEFEGDLADVERDIIVVPETPRDDDGQKERLTPADLALCREDEPNVPLTKILDDNEQSFSEEEMTEPPSANLKDGMQEMF
ncbi:hypothetical protein [Halocatena marina]|uniref:hypothetical protein n=1 Tax=Halocatena marina TaxID=2934937 RepID=UPI00200E0CB5|nr:hypothetical protein [Halocatena marina]